MNGKKRLQLAKYRSFTGTCVL